MIEAISSLQNPLVKSLALLKQRKHRDKQGFFCMEGVRLCEEFAATDWEAESCLYTAAVANEVRTAAVLHALETKGCRLICVSEAVLAKVTETEQPQGILVIGRQRRFSALQVLQSADAPLIAVLDGIQDPGNVGTIIRTADAAGCDGIIVLEGAADLFSGKVVRAAMGSLFHLPVAAEVQRKELVSLLAGQDFTLAITALESAEPYYAADLHGPLAVVFGNEGQGVHPELIGAAQRRITIPIDGQAESLNVAASAAVVLFEAARQRRANL